MTFFSVLCLGCFYVDVDFELTVEFSYGVSVGFLLSLLFPFIMVVIVIVVVVFFVRV